MSNDVLSVAEAADLLGVTRQAVFKAIKKGTLSAAPVVERGRVTKYLLNAEVVYERSVQREVVDGCLNINQAAAYLDCSSSTIAKYMADGLVPFDRNSLGIVSIKIDDLDAIERPKLGRPKLVES